MYNFIACDCGTGRDLLNSSSGNLKGGYEAETALKTYQDLLPALFVHRHLPARWLRTGRRRPKGIWTAGYASSVLA